MSKDELQDILREYGVNRVGLDRYYLDLALVFCKAYMRMFSKEKILSLKDSNNSIKDSRLVMEDLFKDNEIKDLTIDDEHIFYMNGKPYFAMNLKKQIRKMWIDGKEKPLVSLMYLERFLDTINEEDKVFICEELREYQEQQIFLSYFYKYVLVLLEENIKTEFDYAKVGCFTNAYFDIINYQKIELNNGRNV